MQSPKSRNTKTKRLTTAAIILLATALLIGILTPLLDRIRSVSPRMSCGSNISGLGRAMLNYAADHNDMYPNSSKWCDLLIEYGESLETIEVNKSMFRCKGASEGPCNYALNKNVQQLGAYAPPDMVVLFETVPGWNKVGGPEIITTENHHNEGCNVLLSDMHVYFIKAEDINDLKWTATPEDIHRIHQSQQRMREANK